MLLKKLIKDIPKNKENTLVSGISSNSENVKKNYIYFAIRGVKINGESFINSAIKKGATVVVCSNKCNYKNKKVLVIKKKDVRYFLSEISSNFYKLKPKNIIAVTGTNGKTSVADIFFQILKLNNIPVASIGTLGIKFNNNKKKTDLTLSPNISLLINATIVILVK